MTLLVALSLVLLLLSLPFAVGAGGSSAATLLVVLAAVGLVGALIEYRRRSIAPPLRPQDGELLESEA